MVLIVIQWCLCEQWRIWMKLSLQVPMWCCNSVYLKPVYVGNCFASNTGDAFIFKSFSSFPSSYTNLSDCFKLNLHIWIHLTPLPLSATTFLFFTNGGVFSLFSWPGESTFISTGNFCLLWCGLLILRHLCYFAICAIHGKNSLLCMSDRLSVLASF